MPGFNKSAPVQLNVDTVVATARRLAAGADAKKPLLVGADGAMHVSTPTRKLPDGWTKFKAALVNVPLIGRLPTIREAAQLIRAAEFRDNFQAELADTFGNDIAIAVMARDGKPPKATLSSRKVVKVVDRAQERATAVGRQNDAAIGNAEWDQDDVGRYARLLGIATHQDYFRKPLDASTRVALRAKAESTLQRLFAGAGLPPACDAILRRFERRLASARAADQTYIATACLAELDNVATIVELAPQPPRAEHVCVVQLLCAQANGSTGSRYSPELAAQAWTDLALIQARLHEELPSVSEDGLADVMREVTAGQSQVAPAQLHQAARKELFIREMKRQFNPDDSESTLWNAVIEATAQHPGDHNITALMTSIAKEMLLDLDFRWPTLPGHFDCADHLPTIIARTREQLIEHTKMAAREHIEALEFIEQTDTLTPSQKDELRRYAAGTGDLEKRTPQRLSPVQVEQMSHIANTIAHHLPLMEQANSEGKPWTGEPAVLFDSMAEIGAAFQSGMREILQHAESMWISRSFDGTDTEQRIFDVCTRLAMGRLQDSPREYPVNSLPLPPPAAHERHYDPPIRQFLSACNQSPSMHISKFAMFYGDIARVTGHAYGLEDGAPLTPLSLTRPELLVRTLAHPSGSPDEGGALDDRGVLIGSPGGALVAQDFRLNSVLDRERHEVSYPAPDTAAIPTTDLLSNIIGGANILIDGRRLIGGADEWTQVVSDKYSEALASDPKVGHAIASCMASNALPTFVKDVNAAAFHPEVTMANLRGAHEIWRDRDGSWYVRSTRVGTPMGQDGKAIRTDGVVLYTLTHRIEPATGDAAPRVSLHDSNVVFAF